MEVIPMSLRTEEGEKAYQLAKKEHKTKALEFADSIHVFDYWRLIDNEYPYTVAFSVHHMLLPNRTISERFQLNVSEKAELEKIIKYFVYPNYDLWFENSPSRRSMNHIYHLHLATYRKDRLI